MRPLLPFLAWDHAEWPLCKNYTKYKRFENERQISPYIPEILHPPHQFALSFFNVCLFLRETGRQSERGRGRDRETQNLKQAPGSEPSAQSPTRGSNPRTMRSRPEPKLDAQPPEPPRCPSFLSLLWSFRSLFVERLETFNYHRQSTGFHVVDFSHLL